jgi:hypothetical protein
MFQPSKSEGPLSVVNICRILCLICDSCDSLKSDKQRSDIKLLNDKFFKLSLPSMDDIEYASKKLRRICSKITKQDLLRSMNMLPFDSSYNESIPLMLMESINDKSATLVLGLDKDCKAVLDETIERVKATRLNKDPKKKSFKECEHGCNPELCATCISGNDDKSSSPAPSSSKPKPKPKPSAFVEETANYKERPKKRNQENRTSAMGLVNRAVSDLPEIDAFSINLLVEITWQMELSIPFDVIERLVTCLAIGIYPALMIEQMGIGPLVKSHINSLIASKHINVILLARSSDPILGLNLQDNVNVFILNNLHLDTHHVTQVSGRVGRRTAGSLKLQIKPYLFDMRQSVKPNCDLAIRPSSFFGTPVTMVPPVSLPVVDQMMVHSTASVFGSQSGAIQQWINTSGLNEISLCLMENIVSVFDKFPRFLNPDDTTRWAVHGSESWGITGIVTNIMVMISTSFQMPYVCDKTSNAEIPILFFSSELADKKFRSVIPKKEDQTRLFDAFRKIIRDACSLAIDGDKIVQLLPIFEATGIISGQDGLSLEQVKELREIIKGLLHLLSIILRIYTTGSKMYVFINEVYEWLIFCQDKLNVRILATLDFEKKSRPLPPVDAFILANPTDVRVRKMKEMKKCLERAKRAFFSSCDPSQVEVLRSAVSEIECNIAELRSVIESEILSRMNASTVAKLFDCYTLGLLALAKPLPGLCAHLTLETPRNLLNGKRELFSARIQLIPFDKSKYDSDITLMNNITRRGGVNWNGTAREARKMFDLQIGCLESLCDPTFSVVIDGVVNTVRVNTPLKEIQQTASEFEDCFCELELRDDNKPEVIQALRDRISALLSRK